MTHVLKRIWSIVEWSPTLALTRALAASEEFTTMLGWRYVLNIYRVTAAVTSLAGANKPKYSIHREVSIAQLIAVVLTLLPLRMGFYVYAVGIQSAALGAATFGNNLQIFPQIVMCVCTNALARMAWHTRAGEWPVNAMTQYEWQMRWIVAGLLIGAKDSYRRAKLWYIELVAEQDKKEAEIAAEHAKRAQKKTE